MANIHSPGRIMLRTVLIALTVAVVLRTLSRPVVHVIQPFFQDDMGEPDFATVH